jgi:hypothetical protein
MKLARFVGALALASIAVTTASAQSVGGLSIRVIDNSDKTPVIGAAVTLSNTSKLVATSTLITDAKGVALFPVLRAGPGYVIQVIMDGYAGIRQEVSVSLGTPKDVVIVLVPEKTEVVTVIGDKGVKVDLDKNQTSTSFSSDFIQDLPVQGRFYQNVLALAPGVQDPDGDGNPNVNGARERDFKTQVSGVSNVDPLTGTFLNLVTQDSIEDLTVITAGAGAEFGRAQGGFAQIIQKQGSNNFEGVFGMIYSSKLLDGTGSTNTPDSLQPDFFNYQPSLQVSGPIVPDKLWYRLSQEVIYREDPLVLAAGGSTLTTGTRRFSTDNQITWQVSNRNKLAFNFRADPLTQTNVGISPLVPVSSSEKQQSGGPTYTLTWTAPYSPSLLVDSIVAYQDTHLDITPTDSGVQNNCSTKAPYLINAQCFNTQNGQISGSSPRIWHDARQRLTVKSDATYYKGRMWGAVHQFKFGVNIENERYFRDLQQSPTFFRQESLSGNTGQGTAPIASYVVTAAVDPDSHQRALGTAVGIYGEDVIRPISNLSLTVGVRVEQENVNGPGFLQFDPQAESDAFSKATSGLSFLQTTAILQNAFVKYEDLIGSLASVNDQIPLIQMQPGKFYNQLASWNLYRQSDDINIHNTNVAPRLSLSWDPWNDGKTKFAFSAGRYYDKIFLGVLTQESQPVDTTFSIPENTPQPAYNPSFNFTTIDRNLKTPYNDEFTLSATRTFLQENSISLTYIHRNFQRQLERHNLNQITGDYGRCVLTTSPSQNPLVPAPGTGTLVDPYTGQTYQDTDPGIGDGRIDDCRGKTQPASDTGGGGGTAAPTAGALVDRPDGVADFYQLNPAWGDIRELGNRNTANYQGITLEYVRRQYKNWQMEASYTYSKAIGDSEDFSLLLGNDRSTLSQERGYLAFDRTHALKVNATCITPWGFRLGGAASWQSGLPYSIVIRNVSTSVPLPTYVDNMGHTVIVNQIFQSPRTRYPTLQRNDQRNGSAWNFDVNLVKEFSLPKGMNLQFQAKIFNLFGEDTYTVYNSFIKYGEQVNGTDDATRRFGRQYEIGMRLAF